MCTYVQFVILIVDKPQTAKFVVQILQLDQSPAFLTFDDFVRSNEIVRTKWSIY